MLQTYLDGVELVRRTKGVELVRDFLDFEYFSKTLESPEVLQVVELTEDFGLRVESMISGAQGLLSELHRFRGQLTWTPVQPEPKLDADPVPTAPPPCPIAQISPEV